MLKFYILATISAFLMTISAGFCWPILVIIFLAWRGVSEVRVYALATFTGILTDFLTGRLLGISAVLFLLLIYLIRLFRERFGGGFAVMLAFIIVFEMIYYFLFFRLGIF